MLFVLFTLLPMLVLGAPAIQPSGQTLDRRVPPPKETICPDAPTLTETTTCWKTTTIPGKASPTTLHVTTTEYKHQVETVYPPPVITTAFSTVHETVYSTTEIYSTVEVPVTHTLPAETITTQEYKTETLPAPPAETIYVTEPAVPTTVTTTCYETTTTTAPAPPPVTETVTVEQTTTVPAACKSESPCGPTESDREGTQGAIRPTNFRRDARAHPTGPIRWL